MCYVRNAHFSLKLCIRFFLNILSLISLFPLFFLFGGVSNIMTTPEGGHRFFIFFYGCLGPLNCLDCLTISFGILIFILPLFASYRGQGLGESFGVPMVLAKASFLLSVWIIVGLSWVYLAPRQDCWRVTCSITVCRVHSQSQSNTL